MEDWPELSIGEVARRAGVATSTIRYYESVGLLPEPERVSGQRRYRDDVVGTLAFIGVAQSAGLKLREVRELMSSMDSDAGMAHSMRSISSRKLPEVEAMIERAKAMEAWLEAASGCECRTPAECTLFEGASQNASTPEATLRVVQVPGADGCRRTEPAGSGV